MTSSKQQFEPVGDREPLDEQNRQTEPLQHRHETFLQSGQAEEPEPLTENEKEGPQPNPTGWLTFFLWVGLGGGAIVSLGIILHAITGNDPNFFTSALLMADALILVATAAYAIWAFYKHRSNAVAIAKSYIAMIVIDALTGIVIARITGDNEGVRQVVRQFIWAGIWFSYLTQSQQVEKLFPTAKRTWGTIEKYALALSATCCVSIVALVAAQRSVNVMLGNEAYIRQSIEATELPVEIGEGMELSNVAYEGDTLQLSYRMTGVDQADITADMLAQGTEEGKRSVLDEWDVLLAGDPFLGACCAEKATIVYVYFDRSDEFLYEVVIAPEEYEPYMEGLGPGHGNTAERGGR